MNHWMWGTAQRQMSSKKYECTDFSCHHYRHKSEKNFVWNKENAWLDVSIRQHARMHGAGNYLSKMPRSQVMSPSFNVALITPSSTLLSLLLCVPLRARRIQGAWSENSPLELSFHGSAFRVHCAAEYAIVAWSSAIFAILPRRTWTEQSQSLFPFCLLRAEVTSSSEIWYVLMSHSYIRTGLSREEL